jgi:5-oxoprolinase (ATP-hydrolysing) subunit A
MKLDLNCDLGEGEPRARTRALMRCIGSANVACGGHAGDLESMQACVRLAKEFGVRLGAHPGPWSRADLGREPVRITPEELELLLLQQVGALERLARDHKVRLHHVKLHGALYHATEADESLAVSYLTAVRKWWPGVKVFARGGGTVARIARYCGVSIWEEVFADRRYDDGGLLVSRHQPRALLTKPAEVIKQVRGIVERQEIVTASGTRWRVQPRTLCLHSDTPGAVKLAQAVCRLLRP